ncbi:MAG: hypothetical protein QM535_22720 [Limnohabitans sp.]|nr:hypothetical protein [Limnohabitans sp.]
MSNKKRRQNEKEYQNWSEITNGGRLYWKEVAAGDKSGRVSRYEKTVDCDEITISFIQKILDVNRNAIEIHEKYPINKGHIILIILLFLIVSVITYNFV